MIKNKIVNRGLLILVTATVGMAFILGCSESRNLGQTTMTYNGPSRDLGGGSVYAFETTDASGKPIAIGLKMSEAALNDLQAEPPHDMTTSELTGTRRDIFQKASTINPILIFIST